MNSYGYLLNSLQGSGILKIEEKFEKTKQKRTLGFGRILYKGRGNDASGNA